MNNEPFSPDPGRVNPTEPAIPPIRPTSEPVAFRPDIVSAPPTVSAQPMVGSQPSFNAQPPVVQPVTVSGDFGPPPAIPTASTAVSAAGPLEYSSNPFRSSAKGLGLVLTVNPTSSLFVGLFTILLLFVGIIVGGLASVLLAAVLPGAAKVVPFFVIGVAMIVAMFRLYAAITQIYDKSMVGETISSFQALGRASSKGFFRFCGAVILMAIFTLLATILLIIPGIIVGARLSMAPFIVYTENLGAMAALKRSWRLSKGHTWEMISAVFASYLVVGGSGGLLSLVGAQSGTANRYYELKQAEQNGSDTGKMHWLNVFLPVVFVLLMAAYFGLIGYSISRSYHNRTDTITSSGSIRSYGNTSPAKDYCYFVGNGASATSDCVTKSECQTIPDCSSFYFNASGGSSDGNSNSSDTSSGFDTPDDTQTN